ncbi:hypothetical protein BDV27DRAFT_170950 [Aspergillus caelatus]|uniref:NmrA-like domain-containing protein n=1 Tax=Aspergillus caelatus TaxID=61420 RepID=A0A5N7A9G5_9EURO|nr:uncharacterized protein BDV27DRAFT_170950 [Aspergillus caelatus]KAE8366365.1 hypothetical protein BDV27DRAFT_170950 [Aspergillus caelatus]
MSTSTFFVCGATGTQGGAVINHLLKAGAEVHAITRNLDTPAAQNLQSRGVHLTQGDFTDLETFKQSMKGCTALFLNLMPDLRIPNSEVHQAENILSAAKEAGIKHVIYSSGFSVNEPQRLKNWDPNSFVAKILLNKQTVEGKVRTAGFEYWTILRPGNFMANYLQPLVRMYPGFVEAGVWTTALLPETKLPMVDHNDIGAFGAAALFDPARFHEKEIEIASEFLHVEDVTKALSRATGRDLKAVFLSQEEVEKQATQNPFIGGQLLARDMAQFVDLEEVRAWKLPLGTFEKFLEREKEMVNATWSA